MTSSHLVHLDACAAVFSVLTDVRCANLTKKFLQFETLKHTKTERQQEKMVGDVESRNVDTTITLKKYLGWPPATESSIDFVYFNLILVLVYVINLLFFVLNLLH